MATMSRLLPCPKLRDRELGPAQAALRACIPQQQDRQMGCQEGTVQAVWCPLPQEEAQQQPKDPALYWFYSPQVPRSSRDATSLQLCPAQHGSWDPSFPSSPAACTSWGQNPCPAGLPWPGESLSSRDAEPLSAVEGPGDSSHPQPTLHHGAGQRSRPKDKSATHQPPVRKSIHFITDSKVPVAVPGGPHLHRMFPLFSRGKRRGEQTQLTQLTALWC